MLEMACDSTRVVPPSRSTKGERMKKVLRRWLALLLVALVAAAARAQMPAIQTANSVRVEDFVARANEYETKHQWQRAADIYERALRLYPQRLDLKERWQRAEQRYSLSRRYHDPSYVGELLALSDSQAQQLYREVLGKIQTHYVTSIDLQEMVRLGYRYLDLALSDPLFLSANFAPSTTAPAVELRRALRKRVDRPIHSIDDAMNEVIATTAICRLYGLRSDVAIILEFVTAACEGLDPYSTHLSPNRLRDLYSMIDGNFVGLGIEVRGEPEGLLIVNVLSGSPAEAAHLEVDDVIVAVDRQSILGLVTEEAANRLQGESGTTVLLDIRSKAGGIRVVPVTRGEVIVHSVTHAEIVDPEHGVGYVRLSSFQKRTVRELEVSVTRLERQGMKTLILDLRGNPGGLLDVALKVANRFIDHGVLVSTQGRAWGQSWSHMARRKQVWTFPLVVLVDGESASASEILAGAIRDHGSGTVVGTRTYGKGSVQSILPLRSAETGLRLTTAHFFSPKGRVYQNVGVLPDVLVSREIGPLGEELPVPREPSPDNDTQLREALRLLTAPQLGEATPAHSLAGG